MERAHRWLNAYRGIEEVLGCAVVQKGRAAAYDPDVLPPFFGIKKK